ncbi:MAG: NADP-specific glutamate dehydrogenase [Deltaproteobacteria bacterium]|nr:NADP-specific glutamate dehydrogenase [Deltaproteobacteria bacterium]
MHPYTNQVLENLKKKYYWQKEFLQSVEEVFDSISLVLDQNPVYKSHKILERIVEPERIITFRVPWRDDKGEIQINTGYRVEFNSAIGPYKGGLRFHASVTLSVLKFLGFEQTFKNALTGLPMGGGKGGSDFNPRGRSDREIENFCQSFMIELSKHIGANVNVPAGDIGVGSREIGYLFGQYKRLKNVFDCILTGKGIDWGGINLRPEATGYGLVYFADEMLKTRGESFKGKKVAVSGFGNVAWGTVKKATELGGKVITLSGPDGYILDPEGISGEKIDFMLKMRLSGNDTVKDYADKYKVPYHPNKKPWEVKCDIALPCATENELNESDAKQLVENGVFCVAEGANLPTSLDAIKVFINNKILFSPGKASNAGGVATSGLEISQNASKIIFTHEQVDTMLKGIMVNIHKSCASVAEKYGHPGNYVIGANIAGFHKVANAMIDQGLV